MHEGTGKIIIPRLRFGHAGFKKHSSKYRNTKLTDYCEEEETEEHLMRQKEDN